MAMDGMRQISQAIFHESQKFNRVNSTQTFEALLMSRNFAEGSSIKRNSIVETDLLSWTSSSNAEGDAELQLVCVTSSADTSLNISWSTFSDMIHGFGIDAGVLHMICNSKDGFNFFPGTANDNDSILPTWYAGTPRYAVVWTFEAKHSHIRGVVIERGPNVFNGLANVLEKFADYIHAPHRSTDRSHARIVNASSRNGGAMATFTIDETLALSRKVHEVASKIKNHDRLRQISARMLDYILTVRKETSESAVASTDQRKKYNEALHKLSEAVPMLQRQLNASANYLTYMQYRAENLSQVIIALLTHEDAAASINLAEASKKDTSSMKTIAIMTMIFLPATFFAALFSVPLLQWDQSPVVQTRFWVYWAFTLPSTAVVFAIWLAATSTNGTFLVWKDAKKKVMS
ncbi:hypothetical protein DM02DRAFT_726795 [Periconia macrospinosa]|uniref:Uncharacterized protein n=1 Tax=Periconia macrospinosa TaxID=97972 RepID=A0A2V1E058_9PLEO|nr:hypothetical protein DM02DRAFT_726795 [Periconia macrospinosa]